MSFRIALYDVAKSAVTSLTQFYLSSNQLISEFSKGLKIIPQSGLSSTEAGLIINADDADFASIMKGRLKLVTLTSAGDHQAIFDSSGELTYKDHTIIKYKASDQAVTLTTFANDNHLSFPIGANEVWAVEVQVFMKNNQNDYRDVNYKFTVPSGCINKGSGWYYDNVNFGSKLAPDHDYANGTSNLDLTLQRMFKQLNYGYVQTGIIKGLFKNGSSAGTIQLQWAKDINVPTSSCTIFALSYLKAQMIL